MTAVAVSQRQAIADALSSVPGLTGYTQEPATVSIGDAWPVYTATEWTTPCLTAVLYNVFVALPKGDLESTTEAMEATIAPVADALVSIACATVQRCEPAQLTVSDQAGGVPVLVFALVIG